MNRSAPELRLKAAFRDLVAAAGGNVRAATLSRADSARLSRYGAVQETTQAPIDVIAALEREVGEPIVTRVLAELAGYELVPREKPVETGQAMLVHVGEIAGSAGQLLAELSSAVADQTITPTERETIDERARDAITQIEELRSDLRSGART